MMPTLLAAHSGINDANERKLFLPLASQMFHIRPACTKWLVSVVSDGGGGSGVSFAIASHPSPLYLSLANEFSARNTGSKEPPFVCRPRSSSASARLANWLCVVVAAALPVHSPAAAQ